jgi:hypothetical protein
MPCALRRCTAESAANSGTGLLDGKGVSPRASDRLRIVVLGYVIRGPLGGMVWSNLQFLMGLADLGHDVHFVEDSDDYPACYDPQRHVTDTDPSYGLRFAAAVFARIGFGQRWAYFDAHTSRWHGPAAEGILATCACADLVLNLCGVNPLRAWLRDVPVRVFVDEDPAFTQIRHLTDPAARQRAAAHTAFFTFAENFGQPQCTVPDDGFPWKPCRQPLVPGFIVPSPGHAGGRYTTVMQWESYAGSAYAGMRFGMKAESFAPYLDLPARVGHVFELAIGGTSAPRTRLAAKGWRVIDPLAPTRDPWTYQDYIAASKAEFSVAKHGYVVSRSGWFSERSVAYLAAARPVIIQDTGFTAWLHADAGVLPFTNPDEAVAAIADVNARYAAHCRAARAAAEEYFDARKVLPPLIERAMRTSRTAVADGGANAGVVP